MAKYGSLPEEGCERQLEIAKRLIIELLLIHKMTVGDQTWRRLNQAADRIEVSVDETAAFIRPVCHKVLDFALARPVKKEKGRKPRGRA